MPLIWSRRGIFWINFFLVPIIYDETLAWDQKQRKNAERVNEIQQLEWKSLKHNAAVPSQKLSSQPAGVCKAVKAKFNTFKKNPGEPTILDNQLFSWYKVYLYIFCKCWICLNVVSCSLQKIRWNNNKKTPQERLPSSQRVYKMESGLWVEEVINFTVFFDFTHWRITSIRFLACKEQKLWLCFLTAADGNEQPELRKPSYKWIPAILTQPLHLWAASTPRFPGLGQQMLSLLLHHWKSILSQPQR